MSNEIYKKLPRRFKNIVSNYLMRNILSFTTADDHLDKLIDKDTFAKHSPKSHSKAHISYNHEEYVVFLRRVKTQPVFRYH